MAGTLGKNDQGEEVTEDLIEVLGGGGKSAGSVGIKTHSGDCRRGQRIELGNGVPVTALVAVGGAVVGCHSPQPGAGGEGAPSVRLTELGGGREDTLLFQPGGQRCWTGESVGARFVIHGVQEVHHELQAVGGGLVSGPVFGALHGADRTKGMRLLRNPWRLNTRSFI